MRAVSRVVLVHPVKAGGSWFDSVRPISHAGKYGARV
jgi:hypothetical protein